MHDCSPQFSLWHQITADRIFGEGHQQLLGRLQPHRFPPRVSGGCILRGENRAIFPEGTWGACRSKKKKKKKKRSIQRITSRTRLRPAFIKTITSPKPHSAGVDAIHVCKTRATGDPDRPSVYNLTVLTLARTLSRIELRPRFGETFWGCSCLLMRTLQTA